MKKVINTENVKELAIGMFYYTSGSILGPLIFFAVIGYALDKLFGTSPRLLVAGVVLAFITTNILLFKKMRNLNTIISKYRNEKKKTNKDKG